MEDKKQVAQSLSELVSQIESTIPHAKNFGYLGVSVDISLDVAQELVEKLALLDKPDADNRKVVLLDPKSPSSPFNPNN
ncbi:hypothetical protein PVU22_17160 [Vibrio cholerae]|uniref:hypothetical protein n=1 Tax=Vibrio cholerae TaxID=666 RepID=UPI0012EC2F82|nr:hypothetical protein [Vibrio cholerae]MBS3661128.1 hypothetical protein [Vibrio cholerae]MDD9696509.1 hypothetical protein [Vibrio cholerae]MDD9705384.1 hypothetical protein [Vibrio cholerae]MVE04462.1 hypothetical protein [Vibrio cholerae]MVE45235.1 hypothetical protein [Vibrio cholerae]